MIAVGRVALACLCLTVGMAAAGTSEHRVGALILADAFSRATLPIQPVAGAFLTITNTGDDDDVLIAVFAEFAGRAEIHEMRMEGELMRMRPLADGLTIPAGGSVALMPGGAHLMFSQLTQPLVEGETFEATLEFRDAGLITLSFPILGRGAKSLAQSDWE